MMAREHKAQTTMAATSKNSSILDSPVNFIVKSDAVSFMVMFIATVMSGRMSNDLGEKGKRR